LGGVGLVWVVCMIDRYFWFYYWATLRRNWTAARCRTNPAPFDRPLLHQVFQEA
jgi:hypothetical protein